MWELSARKIRATERAYDESRGSPVFTVEGAWTSRGWTEWTQGFQYGSAILQFDATGEQEFLDAGPAQDARAHGAARDPHRRPRPRVQQRQHLRQPAAADERGARSRRTPGERDFYELALKVSGAVQARRWTRTADGGGFIYSFNGPHSLFVDTIRSLRALAARPRAGHVLMEENDRRVSLLERLVQHAAATARYSVYYGEGRDAYDVRGRVAHESIFNVNDGSYRCPSSQQGYSPFTTWTRGLAWAILGFAEQLEFLETLPEEDLAARWAGRRRRSSRCSAARCRRPPTSTSRTRPPTASRTGTPARRASRGWATGASAPPTRSTTTSRWTARRRPSPPGAAAARQLAPRRGRESGERYRRPASPCCAPARRALPRAPTTAPGPAAALRVPPAERLGPRAAGPQGPCGESSMWGDYHLREAALYAQRLLERRARRSTFWTGEDAR